jgi:hypothetical protein
MTSDIASTDPTVTDPENYTVVFENDRVRVLRYRDTPGTQTHLHHHPDSVMITLSDFTREITVDGAVRQVELHPGGASWLSDQSHVGHNVGSTDTHVMFVELK